MDRQKMNEKLLVFFILALIFVMAIAPAVSVLELSPRAYWQAPKGTMVVIFGYVYSSGDVLMDPSIPISGEF